ncbi:MAG: hypothetical protein JXA81_15580 [Sedimentisphaerales bacterium]|nr:hypothetical protein [Sedimentisphaerales bacterium]
MCDYNEFREEDGYQNEIPRWVWFTGQFLFRFQETLEYCPQTTIARFWEDFKNSQGLQNCQGFHLKNQGTLLMLLYGLLVVPRGMWERRQQYLPDFSFTTRNRFDFHAGNQNMTAIDFLKYMRNALAHANFEIDVRNGTYMFWNRQNYGRGNIDFEVKINHCGLGMFVTEVGQYFINTVLLGIQQ